MTDNERKQKKCAKPVRMRGGPEAVDVYVGGRVRQLRTMLGMSQEKLGEALGLTFQQVQKYERGVNRIGASRLYQISEVLDVSINYFFEDISPSLTKKRGKAALAEAQAEYDHDPMAKRETLELVRSYYKIKDPKVRRRIFDLIKQLGKTRSEQ